MIVLPCKQTTFIDVDETLVLWSPTQEQLDREGIEFECPESYGVIDGELKPSGSWRARLVPHKKHIEQLKNHKMRNHTVIVWSAGGYDWAETVVRTLGLELYVDLVISKPTWCYDDKQPEEFIPKPFWLKDE